AVIWLTYESASGGDWEALAEENKITFEEEVDIDQTHAGFEIYESSCMSCHGDSLAGEGALGPSLIGIEYSAEEIGNIAKDGIGDMPAGLFTGSDEELEQLVEFIILVNEEAE